MALEEGIIVDAGLRELLVEALRRQASDLHVVSGYPPTCRVHGRLLAMNTAALSDAALSAWLRSACPAEKLEQFERLQNVDFSLELHEPGGRQRFRVNYFYTCGRAAACFRLIPADIPSFEWAGFSGGLAARLTGFLNGLILVTGVTGSGKSTTLAMLVNQLCRKGAYRVITIEDPVEYLFPRDTGSMVTQRELGLDVASFSDGLKYGLRQDPDIMLVGEIRDRDTAQMALSAAETGHVVFSTMHTRDARGAITRYADLFPQSVQGDIRSQLAMSLRSVVSQHLLPSTAAEGKRVLALEVLFNTLPVASAIRQGKVEAIDNSIVTGKAEGMISLDESLRQLAQAGRISPEIAQLFAKGQF